MITKELIETTLKVALKGKKIANYHMGTEIGNVLQSLFNETEKDLQANIWCRRDDDRSKYVDVWLNCPRTNDKSFCLCVIEVTRTRDWKDDYYYKDFEVNHEVDIDKAIEVYNASVARDNAIKEKKLKEGIELYKAIKAMYPNESKFEIRERIKYLRDNVYSIEDID